MKKLILLLIVLTVFVTSNAQVQDEIEILPEICWVEGYWTIRFITPYLAYPYYVSGYYELC